MKHPAAIVLALLLTLGGAALAATAQTPSPEGKLFVVGVLSGVKAIDLKTGASLGEFPTGLVPHTMLLSPDRKTLYVSSIGSQCISVIDTQKVRKLKDILVGEIPDNAAHRALPPERLRTATSCRACHEQARGTMPNAMAFSPDGKQLLVSETRLRAIDWLDPASGKLLRRKRFDLPGRNTIANFVFQPRSHELWVLHRFENFVPGARGAAAQFDHNPPAGQHRSWVTIHDAGMTRELARIQMPLEVPAAAVFSPDARRLYVAYRSSSAVAVFDTRARRAIATWKTNAAPTGLALSRDGKRLYVACTFSHPGMVQELETRRGEILHSYGVPPTPLNVLCAPSNGHLFVPLAGTNQVIEIDRAREAIVRSFPAGQQPMDLVLTP